MDVSIFTLAFGILIVKFSSGQSQTDPTVSPPWNCGKHVLSDSGYIKSPNYPSNYPDNLDCIWQISTSQPGINVYIDSGVFLQYCGAYTCDFLEVRDGPDSNSPLLTRFTGDDSNPKTLYAYSSNLWVRLRTDFTGTDKGFYIGFESAPRGTVLFPTTQSWTTITGRITSPTPKPTTKSSTSASVEYPHGVVINNNNNMYVNFFDWSKLMSWFNPPNTSSTTTTTTSTTTQQPQTHSDGTSSEIPRTTALPSTTIAAATTGTTQPLPQTQLVLPRGTVYKSTISSATISNIEFTAGTAHITSGIVSAGYISCYASGCAFSFDFNGISSFEGGIILANISNGTMTAGIPQADGSYTGSQVMGAILSNYTFSIGNVELSGGVDDTSTIKSIPNVSFINAVISNHTIVNGIMTHGILTNNVIHPSSFMTSIGQVVQARSIYAGAIIKNGASTGVVTVYDGLFKGNISGAELLNWKTLVNGGTISVHSM